MLVYSGHSLVVRLFVTQNEGTEILFSSSVDSLVGGDGARVNRATAHTRTVVAKLDTPMGICIENKGDSHPKKVKLEVLVRPPPGGGLRNFEGKRVVSQLESGFPGAASPTDMMHGSAERMMRLLRNVSYMQSYHSARERRHQETLESTNVRLVRWSTANLVSIALAQVILIAVVRMWFRKTMELPGSHSINPQRWSPQKEG